MNGLPRMICPRSEHDNQLLSLKSLVIEPSHYSIPDLQPVGHTTFTYIGVCTTCLLEVKATWQEKIP